MIETTDVDPADRFHPSLVWALCPPEVVVGWQYKEGQFLPAALSQDDYFLQERLWRDSQLNANEWLVARHRDELDLQRTTTLSSSQFTDLLEYRQALRDWPQSEDFLNHSKRPDEPTWLRDQLR